MINWNLFSGFFPINWSIRLVVVPESSVGITTLINFLASDQQDISNLFASKDTDKLSKVSHYKNEKDMAILYDTLGHLELSVYQQIDIADHVLVIGRVENLSIDNEKDPLLYYRSKYREIR